MVALESTLRSSTQPFHNQAKPTQPLPSVFRAIEYNLPPNYRRHHDTQHGYHWIYRVGKTNLSAHIYPNVDHDIINISIFDDRNPDESELIKKWSGDLRMTGKYGDVDYAKPLEKQSFSLTNVPGVQTVESL